MPIYEYRCQACGHELEALQKMSEDPLTRCPECEQDSLNRLVSAAAFRLSGSGWYETDFKKGNKRNIAGDSEKSGGKEKKADKSSSPDKSSSQGKAAQPA
ncbi:zinc ribbon domain-containing protein [Gammaproteobacteria bacterium AB-CW1]|uniref:Zinc ribbon domain-containing protein n=1 Tax=Natronospira elongata TaxID=3110268 RepID=A0AAP6MLJ7_9GAMM|nr:zinc ribbon domain-containing protein [Gammaproteobacteria bacterium AB-CW1]